MNRVRPGRHCFVCGQDITILAFELRGEGESYIDAMQRQTGNGMDDRCQRARYFAAVAYERAGNLVRLMLTMGATVDDRGHRPLKAAMDAVAIAEYRCVQLKMWPATR